MLYVPGLQTRLFSIENFTSSGGNTAVYFDGRVRLGFGDDSINLTIELPHSPPSSYTSQIHPQQDKTSTSIMCGNNPTIPDPSPPTLSNRVNELAKKRMDVDLAHRIFGHRSVSALMNASNFDVWDDITMTFNGDSWCDSCKIAVAPKHPRSKIQMNIRGKPLENLFIDLIPIPAVLRGIPECKDKNFLFVCDPLSKYVDKINMDNKSATETIKNLGLWRKEMRVQGFNTFLYLRSDAGKKILSEDFKVWCKNEDITLTVAGPKHQEQNAFAESAYKTVNRMSRSMLVQARLPLTFIHLALDYSCAILRVLPAKGLKIDQSTVVTTYELLYGRKPSIRRFKVFGCPVIFKRYQPIYDGDSSTKFTQLQQGSRGIFVGFPRNQAGWLIYVPQKIGNKHLVVSMDVVFDQSFLSSITGTSIPFSQAQQEREIDKAGGPIKTSNESTGDITNL